VAGLQKRAPYPYLAPVLLTWTNSTSPNVVGYYVFYWTNGAAISNEVSAGNATNLVVTNLLKGFDWTFGAVAQNSDGIRSAMSQTTTYSGFETQLWLVLGESPDLINWTNMPISRATNGTQYFRLGWQTRKIPLP
jgi:hypothetical protein